LPFNDETRLFRDILDCIDRINEFTRGMDFSAYLREEKTQAAVERKMQILTEAVIRLESAGSESHLEIDWKAYRGMGNFLRHSYDRVSDEIVWNTIHDDLPGLRQIIEKAITSAPTPDADMD
jgi:uncharacterized protein with HEPN domain